MGLIFFITERHKIYLFRYGLVGLYLGTLLLVIGYHNAWLWFLRYVGMVLVILGSVGVAAAAAQSCFRVTRAREVR